MSLSVSQVRAWNCRRQWWFGYGVRAVAPNPVPAHLTEGSALHAALEAAYTAARDSAPTAPGTVMRHFEDVALGGLDRYLHRQHVEPSADLVGVLLDLLDALPVPRPAAIVGIEQQFRIPLPSGEIVEGSIDLALRTGPTSLHIRDWKHSSTPDIDSMQLAVYTSAARILWPWAKKITVGFYSIKKHAELPGELDVTTVELRMEQMEYAGLEMADAMDAHTAGGDGAAIFPTNPGEHCTSCRFRSYCPDYSSPVPLPLTFPADEVASTRADLLRRLDTR